MEMDFVIFCFCSDTFCLGLYDISTIYLYSDGCISPDFVLWNLLSFTKERSTKLADP